MLINKKIKRKPKLYIGSEQEQLRKISEIITSMVEKGEYPGNICILMRSHSKCKMAAEFLNLHGIRTYYHADKLYEQPVIKDVIVIVAGLILYSILLYFHQYVSGEQIVEKNNLLFFLP